MQSNFDQAFIKRRLMWKEKSCPEKESQKVQHDQAVTREVAGKIVEAFNSLQPYVSPSRGSANSYFSDIGQENADDYRLEVAELEYQLAPLKAF